MEKIAAVVVTYNRLYLLKECISALKAQTRKPDRIIVINNSSTDGTAEWLGLQNDLYVVHQENGGGAAGFYRGMKEAYEQGFDWIWVMDDDVEPQLSCLEEMLRANAEYGRMYDVLQPDRKYINFDAEWRYGSRFNFSNPFKPEAVEHVKSSDFNGETIQTIVSFPFEGPMFSRKVIEKIGFADKRFFILYDDTEYAARVYFAGFKAGLVKNGILIKKIRPVNAGIAVDWKMYYQIRNQIILDRKYGNRFVSVTRAFFNNTHRMLAVVKLSLNQKTFTSFPKNITAISKAVIDGFRFKLTE